MENPGDIEKGRVESREPLEMLVESSLEHGVKFDEGQNAIVLEVNPSDLEPNIRQQFFNQVDSAMGDKAFVSKVLRVFSADHSKEEAENQIKAKNIVDSQNVEDRETLAKIPEIYFHKDIHIHSEALKEKLRQAGIEIAGDDLGVLLMYRVEGVDFLNYLLQEAIKRCPASELANRSAVEFAQHQLAKGRSSLSTEELFKIASTLIGFEASDRVRLSDINRDRLLVYLEKYGFILDQQILAKVEKTVSLLNKNDFFHNDLTERNIMLEFDETGQIADMYVIDFEKAANLPDENFGGEMSILGHYKDVLKGRDHRLEEALEQNILTLEKLRLRVLKSRPTEYQTLFDKVKDVLKTSGTNDLDSKEGVILSDAAHLLGDQSYDLLTAILFDIAQHDKESVQKYIKLRLSDHNLSIRYFNLLSRLNNKL